MDDLLVHEASSVSGVHLAPFSLIEGILEKEKKSFTVYFTPY